MWDDTGWWMKDHPVVDCSMFVDDGCFSHGQTTWGCIVKNSAGTTVFSVGKKQHITMEACVAQVLGVR